MLVPTRHGSSDSYRYGFQGQEKDDEIKGEGNSLNYTYRMHDPRIGRFFAIDPLTKKYPWYTPYSFSGNKVIQFVELEGLAESNTAAGSVIMGLLFPTAPKLKREPWRSPGASAANMGAPIAGVALGAVPIAIPVASVSSTAYASYTTWYGTTATASYFAGGMSTVMADLFTVSSFKAAALGFTATSGAQYLSSGFDFNSISFKKNILTSPLGGFGGLVVKSSFQEDKETGSFAPSTLQEFALDFSFGKIGDGLGKKIKDFKLPQFSSSMGTVSETLLQMGAKTTTNVVKKEIKKDLKQKDKANKTTTVK